MAGKRALITGVTGQDGSYLAEFLLERGYEVHGMVRRASTETFQRLTAIRDRIVLHTGDLLDQRSLVDVLRETRPEEVYNLAAMSFVAASWVQPTLTAEFTGVGVTRMLEAIREVCPEARFYQASSSEMFGKVREVPQSETTPFYPRSPYGVAKAYGHFITVNYRESYDLFACSGILFNHECLRASTPLVIRRHGVVEVETPCDLVPIRTKGPSVQMFAPDGLEVWDGDGFTAVTAISATRRRETDPRHRMLAIEARAGIVEVTAHHRMLDADHDQVEAAALDPGDRVALADEPVEAPAWAVLTAEMAELLGLLCAGGYVERDGRHVCFTNSDPRLRSRVTELWSRLFLKTARDWRGRSGFAPGAAVEKLELRGAASVAPWLREQLYTRDGYKRVPPLVLNSDAPVQQAFLRGHYAGDGLKRGKGASVKTNSAVLAAGLAWLYHQAGRPASVYAERRAGRTYYQVNLPALVPVGAGVKGAHLRKDPAEIRRVVEVEPDDGDEFVFDLETESGRFCAGVGRVIVHNSPRRGLEFVTRKVAHGAAAIKLGLQSELLLGNLDAQRDWGYAPEYVEAMWMMLQRDEPVDYVVGTGTAHSVRDLVEVAFDHVGLDPDAHIRIDPEFVRPAEVDHLIADPAKAKRELGWEPRISFEQLVRLMVDADLERLGAGAPVASA